MRRFLSHVARFVTGLVVVVGILAVIILVSLIFSLIPDGVGEFLAQILGWGILAFCLGVMLFYSWAIGNTIFESWRDRDDF